MKDLSLYSSESNPRLFCTFGERRSGKTAFLSQCCSKRNFLPIALSSFLSKTSREYAQVELEAFLELEREVTRIFPRRISLALEHDLQNLGDPVRVVDLFSSLILASFPYGYIFQGVWVGDFTGESPMKRAFHLLTVRFHNFVVIQDGKITRQEGVDYDCSL